MVSNDRAGVAVAQPRTKEERDAVATTCCAKLDMPMPVVVDEIDDRVGNAYSGMPDRLYVIDRDGRVAYKGGRGPFQYKPEEMEQALVMLLLEEADSRPRNEARVPLLDDAKAWERLPRASHGGSGRLPNWARALAQPMPKTTAAMLELDWKQRTRSPLNPKLRAKLRYLAASLNRSPYAIAVARADYRRAGGDAAELDRLDRGEPAPAEANAIEFGRKLTLEADTITDAEVKKLIEHYGERQVTAMVLLLAYANFQDRLLLSLAIPLEDGGPLPPLEVAFEPEGAAPAPERVPPASRHDLPPVPTTVDDPEWRDLNGDELDRQLDAQMARAGRIRIPTWDEVKKGYPPGATVPAAPVRIQWSLVTLGYAPELAMAWSKCTRTFMTETAQDRVFEESLFWVVTRKIHCFY